MAWSCLVCGHPAPLVPTKRPDGSTFQKCGCIPCHGEPEPVSYTLPAIVPEAPSHA